MDRARSFESGVAAGMLLLVGSQAGHWFLTPAAHPDAGPIRTALVAAQLAAGGVAGAARARR